MKSKHTKERKISLNNVIEETGIYLQEALRENLYEMNLDKEQTELLMQTKRELRRALRNCGTGNGKSKQYVKETIRDMLIEKYNINGEMLEQWIPFSEKRDLSVMDKFDILLFHFKKKYNREALKELIKKYRMDEKKHKNGQEIYEITEKEIMDAYEREAYQALSFLDKLEIISQRIFQQYKGLGVIDEIRDMNVDGVSGGVSGMAEEERSIWIFFQGKSIYLSFLKFGSKKELERVCRNLCKYNNPGQLSATRGYIVNEMEDHSRIVTARPPFSENWVFFVRKFDNIPYQTLDALLTGSHSDLPKKILKWLVRGCQVIAVTGTQGSGKTTLLMAMIENIPASYTLRIQEVAFELHLRKRYPERNIVSFRETGTISGQEGLDLQKKTDGTVNILGEVATARVAAWMIQMGQAASLFTLFTHHATTTRNLILSLRNNLLHEGGFTNEQAAEQQVSELVRYDVHLEKDMEGHRYIEKVTEIIPLEKADKRGRMFQENIILEYENGTYFLKHLFSVEGEREIKRHLKKEEEVLFDKDFYIPFSGK